MRNVVRSGGVAVYERKDSIFMATPHVLVKCDAEVHRKALVVKFGDICAAEVMVKRGEGSRRGFLHLAGRMET